MGFDWLELEFNVDVMFLVLDFVLGFFFFVIVVFLSGEEFWWLLELFVLVCKLSCMGVFLFLGDDCFIGCLYCKDLKVLFSWNERNFLEVSVDKEVEGGILLLLCIVLRFFCEDLCFFDNFDCKVEEVKLGIDWRGEILYVSGVVCFKLILNSFVLLFVFGVFLFCDDVLLLEVIRDWLWILEFLFIFVDCCSGLLMWRMKFFVVVWYFKGECCKFKLR